MAHDLIDPRSMNLRCSITLALALATAAGQGADGPSLTRDQLAFFEQKIRPVLAEHCYECHSSESKKLKASLLVDSRAGLLKGGESGKPAVTPGDPGQSLPRKN
jgi:hypothetical protein